MVPHSEAEAVAAADCVLLVEDDAVIRVLFAEVLREAGLYVIEAASATDAVNYLTSNNRVDLVFSDIHMPGPINGLQLVRHVRQIYPALPIVLTSGQARPAGLGDAVTFVAKPYGFFRVLELMQRILGAQEDNPA